MTNPKSGQQPPTPPKADLAHIQQTLSLILEPGSVAELRVLQTKHGTVSGYFDDFTKLSIEAANCSGKVAGVYITLNPVKPDLLARSTNHTTAYAKHTTNDNEIVRLRFLLIDVDAKRPAGISSTHTEHRAAIKLAEQIAQFLVSLGFPRGSLIFGDSGNGAHILVRIDLPNSAESVALLQKCLLALDLQFSDSMSSVDITTYNPARISKIYGTLAAKGDNTQERPHRLARMLKFPAQLVITPKEILEKLSAMVPVPPKTPSNATSNARFDIVAWITKYGLKIHHSKPWNGGTMWILSECVWDQTHCNGEAYIIQFPNGAIDAGCHHSSCSGKTWRDFRQTVEGPSSGIGVSGGTGATSGIGNSGSPKKDKESQATILVELASDEDLFHDPDGDAYATVTVKDSAVKAEQPRAEFPESPISSNEQTSGNSINFHLETWPIRSRGFQRWLRHRYYKETEKTPNSQAFNEAISLLESMAVYDGEEHSVFTRIAELNGVIYLDLTNERWEAVEITTTGWKVINDVPVKFRRAKGMLPLPSPSHGGSIEELRPFVNIPLNRDWIQIKAWLVQACRPKGPYPPLVINGEAGSTKTTTARIIRAIIDPNSAALRSEPREIRDLMIAAKNSHIVAFDNLSHLPVWLSDAICRLATGGGFATRELYTDQDEVIFEVMRPVILNSIEELVVRGDLVDRAIILTLLQLAKQLRRPEKKLWADFNTAHPRILGALLDAVATALKNEPSVKITELPRMADFATWATAAEPALGLSPGEFMKAYQSNRDAANETVLENSSLAGAVRSLVAAGPYSGTPTELYEALGQLVDENAKRERSWPKSLKGLRGNLTRLAPNLREAGISIRFCKTTGTDSRRMVSIYKTKEKDPTEESGVKSDASDAYCATEVKSPRTQLALPDTYPAHEQAQSVTCAGCAGSIPPDLSSDNNTASDDKGNQMSDQGEYEERF